eukprot:COSAG05_NODE_195_length_14550_cov_203.233686_10_plen_93_part_00
MMRYCHVQLGLYLIKHAPKFTHTNTQNTQFDLCPSFPQRNGWRTDEDLSGLLGEVAKLAEDAAAAQARGRDDAVHWPLLQQRVQVRLRSHAN